jgi:hypothetical protein
MNAPQAALPPTLDPRAIKPLLRYLSFVPIVGPGFQFKYGIDEFRSGSTQGHHDGAIDMGLAGCNFTADITSLPIYARFFQASSLLPTLPHPVLAVAGILCGLTGIINTTVDGSRDIANAVLQKRRGQISQRSMAFGAAWGIAKLAIGSVAAFGAVTLSPAIMLAAGTSYWLVAGLQNRRRLGALVTRPFQRSPPA